MKKQNVYSIERFSPDYKVGLTEEQLNSRIQDNLINQNTKKYSKSVLSIFLGNLFTFFNLLGLIVAIALIYVRAPILDFFFCVIFICNILIGIIQELRAKKSIDKLSLISEKTIKVVRNNQICEITSKEIVLDDIIFLGLGSQIPTDSIIVNGEIEVNESLLTGESVPVKKKVGDPIFAGSFITTGSCYARADKVGRENYVEKLSEKAKKYKKPYSELMSSLKIIISVIGVIIVPLAIAFMYKSTGAKLYDSVRGTSTLVIGLIPSGLFLLTSMALAVGVIKLAKHHTLVQDLYSLEMLARVDTICFDKTGTITDGKMNVKDVIELISFKRYSVSDIVGSMLFALKDDNQTAIALKNYFGLNDKLKPKEIMPFNSQRKLSAVSFSRNGTFAFGAPEYILSKKDYSKIKNQINQYAKIGYRVIILASSQKSIENDVLPADFTPIAIVLIVDNIRPDAIDTINWFKANNVNIKVISGDNPITVSEISKRVGIEHAENYISLEGLTENEVYDSANKYTVFGRVSPEQKAILIKALKSAGHTTAMTGDGVNDILALKEADCAITVASGSEAARNVSNIVLTDNNFNSLPKVVYEGRRVINNIQSSASLYLMKTVFTLFIALFTLFLPFYQTYPFQLPHMFMLEMFIIGLPSFFLSLQANDSLVRGRFLPAVIKKAFPSAILMLLNVVFIEIFRLTLGTFSRNVYITMEVYAFSSAGLICLYNICKPINKFRGILFSASLICMLIIMLFLIVKGITGREDFILVPLSDIRTYWHHILIIINIILLDLPIMKLFNVILNKNDVKSVSKNK